MSTRKHGDTMVSMDRLTNVSTAMPCERGGPLCLLSASFANKRTVVCDVTRLETHSVPLLLRPRSTGVSLLNNSDKTYQQQQQQAPCNSHEVICSETSRGGAAACFTKGSTVGGMHELFHKTSTVQRRAREEHSIEANDKAG